MSRATFTCSTRRIARSMRRGASHKRDCPPKSSRLGTENRRKDVDGAALRGDRAADLVQSELRLWQEHHYFPVIIYDAGGKILVLLKTVTQCYSQLLDEQGPS